MSPVIGRFEGFPSWADRAVLGELESVLYAGGSERENLLLHAQSLYGATLAMKLCRRRGLHKGTVLDFGCGSGRTLRFFGQKGWSVIGTEVTREMLETARQIGLPDGAQLYHTDGISIPIPDQAVDLVWVSGVLKYALFDADSKCRGGEGPDRRAGDMAYRNIAAEMYRVLKPGGFVINVEMWVDAPPEMFREDFEETGFVTKKVRVVRRSLGAVEQWLENWRPWHRFPPKWVILAGYLVAAMRYRFDNPRRKEPGFRDYLFVWLKPEH